MSCNFEQGPKDTLFQLTNQLANHQKFRIPYFSIRNSLFNWQPLIKAHNASLNEHNKNVQRVVIRHRLASTNALSVSLGRIGGDAFGQVRCAIICCPIMESELMKCLDGDDSPTLVNYTTDNKHVACPLMLRRLDRFLAQVKKLSAWSVSLSCNRPYSLSWQVQRHPTAGGDS